MLKPTYPQLPSSGDYLNSIRRSSKKLRIESGVLIPPENVKRLLLSPAFLESYNRVSRNHGLTLPLNFSSNLDELNLLSVLSLLNFASGYRVPLHVQTGRGAWDSIRALVFSLYITSTAEGDLLSAKGLTSLNVSQIAEFMGVNLHVERAHESIAGVVVGELGGPLYKLVTDIVAVLNETGGILLNNGYINLGAFVAEALNESSKTSNGETALEMLLEKVGSITVSSSLKTDFMTSACPSIPGFRDMVTVNGEPIYCFKKALFLIHAITVRFGSLTPPPFHIPVTTRTPVFSDNVLPSLLIHLGVVDLSGNAALSALFLDATSPAKLNLLLAPPPATILSVATDRKKIPKEGPVVTIDQSYILRAAAIDACEIMVETAQSLKEDEEEKIPDWFSKITLPDLDMWLWSVAKDRSDYRALERFVDQNTIYF